MALKEGDQVRLAIVRATPLGYSVFINDECEGLLHNSEIFQPVEEGMEMVGYVKKIREDDKIDVALRPQGFRNVIDSDCQVLLAALAARGELFLTDKSPADLIVSQLKMSKKAFKKAVGVLYKQKKIAILEDRIVSITKE